MAGCYDVNGEFSFFKCNIQTVNGGASSSRRSNTNYQLPNGPVKAGRRWGQRHPQGANLANNSKELYVPYEHSLAPMGCPSVLVRNLVHVTHRVIKGVYR